MYVTDHENILFSKFSWHDVARNQKAKLEKEVAAMEGNRLLSTSVDDLCSCLVEKFSVSDVPTLRRDDNVADHSELPVDVSRDPLWSVYDNSQPAYVTGTEIEITVPFDGDENIFKVQPSTFSLNPPQGQVSRGELRIHVRGIDLAAVKIQPEIDKTLNQIDTCLSTIRSDASKLNVELPAVARNSVETRRRKLLADLNLHGIVSLVSKSNSEKRICEPMSHQRFDGK